MTYRHETTNGSGPSLGQSLRPRGPVQFGLSQQRRGEATVIAVAGELDILTAPRFGAFINELVHRRSDELVIDLTDTYFIDSAGLQVLLSAQRRVARAGRGLAVICPEGPARRAFELARLVETLGIVSSFEEYESNVGA